MKIIRTPTKAHGGITPAEKSKMDEHARLWISRAMRTDPIEPEKIIPAIEGIYAAAKLNKPRVVIVPSPLVMAFSYGAAAAIWYKRKELEKVDVNAATRDATDAATHVATDAATYAATRAATDTATYDATGAATLAATGAATYVATLVATHDATRAATHAATDAATHAATRAATDTATYDATGAATLAATHVATHVATYVATYAANACRDIAGALGIACAERWSRNYQGGNMWAGYESYLTACRDILGLELPSHGAYSHWEQAAIHGGFRVMHEEFCMVCDFPEVLLKDEQNRPHCETGPSHRWRDGWSLYHWHGTNVPEGWIEDKKSLTPAIALGQENLELRRAACEILGWSIILTALKAKTIDKDDDPEIGELVEVKLPDLPNKAKFLRVKCGTGREFAIGIPPHINKALDAQAWMIGLDVKDFIRPEIRT